MNDSQAITYRGIRREIGEILVRNHLRTDQVAINELVRLIELEREDAQVVALAMNDEQKYHVGYTEGVMAGRVMTQSNELPESLITHQEDEGTGYYSCEACGRACDPLSVLGSKMVQLSKWPQQHEPATKEESIQAAKEARETFDVTNQNDGNLPEETELNESMNGVIAATKCFIQGTMTKQQRDAVYFAHGKAIEKALTDARREATETALRILDTAEVEQWFDMPNTTDNWRTWKRIRNTIADLNQEAQSSEEKK